MRSVIRAAIASGLSGVLTLSVAVSQDTAAVPVAETTATGQREPDIASIAIRAQSKAFAEAFDKRDAKAVAALWTEDGEYIDDAGQRFAGRDAIEKSYAELFASNPEAKIGITIESIQLLSPVAAIEDGSAVVVPSPAGVTGVSNYTAVHVKVGEHWLMASVRETWTETSPAVRSSADLEWLIGTWDAEVHGVQTRSVCRWVVEDRFLERSYTTTQVDGTKTSGVQLIGWNPQAGHVQSWDFSPDGGHAVGRWSPTDGGWRAEVHGITGDGVSTNAVNVLKRLDDNAYAWQSVQRTLGDTLLRDTDEIIIRRSPAQ